MFCQSGLNVIQLSTTAGMEKIRIGLDDFFVVVVRHGMWQGQKEHQTTNLNDPKAGMVNRIHSSFVRWQELLSHQA
jgi:hypothetical protein